VIDLGPEGGDAGGCLVAEGTPEKIAGTRESYTGQYLAHYLNSGNRERGTGNEKDRTGEQAKHQ
jgi:excinuclease ABC subunit A